MKLHNYESGHGAHYVRRQHFTSFKLRTGCKPRHHHAGSRVQQKCKSIGHLIQDCTLQKSIGKGLITFNFNGINTRLATERRASKCGKGEIVSRSDSVRSTKRLRHQTRGAAFSLAPRRTTEAPLAPLTPATLPPSARVPSLQDLTPTVRACHPPRRKCRPRLHRLMASTANELAARSS